MTWRQPYCKWCLTFLFLDSILLMNISWSSGLFETEHPGCVLGIAFGMLIFSEIKGQVNDHKRMDSLLLSCFRAVAKENVYTPTNKGTNFPLPASKLQCIFITMSSLWCEGRGGGEGDTELACRLHSKCSLLRSRFWDVAQCSRTIITLKLDCDGILWYPSQVANAGSFEN